MGNTEEDMMREYSLVILASVGCITQFGYAQDYNFWLAHGNDAVATLNGKSAGQGLGGFTDVTGHTTMKVRLMVTSTATAVRQEDVAGVMMCSDMSKSAGDTYADFAAYDAARKHAALTLRMGSLTLGKGLPGHDYKTNTATTVDGANVGSPLYAGSFGDTAFKPIGLWHAIGFGLGKSLTMAPQATVMLAEYDVDINLAKLAEAGGTYGDHANEAGLMIFGTSPMFARSTYLGLTTGTGLLKSPVKYKVGLVPEPASMLALGAGLLALARRRRS